MVFFAAEKVLAIIEVIVLRGLRGVIIMGSC